MGTAVVGLNSKTTRAMGGEISFNNSTHLPAIAGSTALKPVILPPGWARLAPKPAPIGSATVTNTIGIVGVSWARALVTDVV